MKIFSIETIRINHKLRPPKVMEEKQSIISVCKKDCLWYNRITGDCIKRKQEAKLDLSCELYKFDKPTNLVEIGF